MNILGSLWESSETNLISQTSHRITWAIAAIIISGCSANNLKNDNTPITTAYPTSWYYQYDPIEIEPIEILWDTFDPLIVSEWVSFNMHKPNEVMDSLHIWSTKIYQESHTVNEDYLKIPKLRWSYSFDNSTNPITILPTPKFQNDYKILRNDISELIDFSLTGCSEWIIWKGEQEFEIKVPLTCTNHKEEKQTYYKSPERWYYDITINGVQYSFPHSDCRQVKEIKWPQNYHIEIFNQKEMWSDLVDFENYTIQKWYLDTCIKEKKSTIRR